MASAATVIPNEPVSASREERFRAFVDAHQDAAIRIAMRLVGGDRAAAEDVAQEAFLRAHRGLAGFREEASLRTWFTRILIREAHRHRRWQKVRHVFRSEPIHELEIEDRTPAPPSSRLRRRLVTALDGLSRRQREALVLVHLEQFTVEETARVLGTSPGTVKTHVHRAIRALRRELADLDPNLPDADPDGPGGLR